MTPTLGVEWQLLAPGPDAARPTGAWRNEATGHLVSFSDSSVDVFHVLDDFCIRDTGVVPEYSLYALQNEGDELLLQYYDYRGRPELLQAPLHLERLDQVPDGCRSYDEAGDVPPSVVFDLVWRTFDRYYRFFPDRGVDWDATRRRYESSAAAARSNEELFDVMAEMLGTLRDGHVNLSRGERSFNAGRPRLRDRLGEAWKASGSDLSEGDWVAAWHRGVQESVYAVLDSGSVRGGAAGAVEWGTISDTVGYIRLNRFSRFTENAIPRHQALDTLRAAMTSVMRDLGDTRFTVVDVALNGGGSDAAALTVASFFADRERVVLEYQALGAPDQEIFLGAYFFLCKWPWSRLRERR